MKRLLFFVVACLLALCWVSALAEIPKLINYQGMLTDESGNPLTGKYDITFKIYNASSGGDKRWEETQTDVAVSDGLFNVILGGATIGGINLDFSEEYWLDVTVEGVHMKERLRFTSVAYAYRARIADSATVAVSAPTGGGWVDDGSAVRLETKTDKVGIGTTSPAEKLHVNGDVRIWSGGDIAFGDDSTRIYETGDDLVFTADDDIHLQPDDDIYIGEDGGSSWIRFDPGDQKLGIGTTEPLAKTHLRGSSLSLQSGAIHLDKFILEDADAVLGLYSGAGGSAGSGITFGEVTGGALVDKWGIIRESAAGGKGLRITYGTNKDQFQNTNMMYIDSSGNVGIGLGNPGVKLVLIGDLEVTGAYKGIIASSSGSDGAPFPRPAYDSDWQTIYGDSTLVLTHNIGGDPDNYVVDLQLKSSYYGIHCLYYGGDGHMSGKEGSAVIYRGAFYHSLTASLIKIYRFPGDMFVREVRVRIWVYR